LRFFGRYSYALYVFHLPVIYFVERYFFGIDELLLFMQSIGRTIAVCTIAGGASVALALLSWHGYEKTFSL
jgi:peptidoglycan/LPS O-acetylase OafA/YrhL